MMIHVQKKKKRVEKIERMKEVRKILVMIDQKGIYKFLLKREVNQR